MFEEKIKEIIQKSTKLKKADIRLEKPKNNFGDFAFPCFILARTLKKNPVEIAKDLKSKLKTDSTIEKIENVGGYLNFFVNKEKFIEESLKNIEKKPKTKKEVILIESPGPNTNKPLHVGHLRNLFIADSIARIFEYLGNNVKRVDIVNDRGIHICKSMLAYQKFGKNKKPDKKSDHFVGDFYVKYAQELKKNPKLEREAKEMLKEWEKGNPEVISLWKLMNKWAIEGMKETYKLLNFTHDKSYKESETYKKGREIVMKGLKEGLFEKKDNAVIINLGKELGDKVLIRSDGTTVYVTQDIYLAKKRYEDYKFDKMIYVVANEQDYHFKVLFKILKILKFKWAEKLIHLSYGMVNLPSGKMKSREGTVIDADNLIQEVKEDSSTELKKRYNLNKKDLDKRSLAIALSAIKFALLKVDTKKDILFNKEEALDFEGFSGPYLQYAYARACSILEKTKSKNKINYKNLKEEEFNLVKKLLLFQENVKRASRDLKPDILVNYTYELAKIFNEFYRECPVLHAKEEQPRRLLLVETFKKIMNSCLNLLGIEALEKM